MDKGREFENKWMEDLCIRRGIERHMMSTEHHKGNGRNERLNRTMREYFRKDTTSESVEEMVKEGIRRYNNSLHSAIQRTPAEAWKEKEAWEAWKEKEVWKERI